MVMCAAGGLEQQLEVGDLRDEWHPQTSAEEWR